MNNIPNPITRNEQYLNNIATGAGEIPEFPVTRTERYLDYIAKNGSGGNVPDPEVADIGKVLGIVEDGAGAKYAPVDASGLPDPSTLTDGTAMVAVNGEWKMQEGYGYVVDAGAVTYSGEGISNGDNLAWYTEQIAIVGVKYDVIIDGQTYSNIECVDFNSMAYLGSLGEDGYPSYDVYPFYIMNSFNWYFNTALEGTHSVEVRLAENEYHKFDSSLIPGVVPAAPSEDGAYVLTCTVTDGEAVYSWETNA